ncbi:tetratricopeptide repeat protein [candidate division WWE3 bacterium]|jgi:protein O-mannosyl-transferase|nr:tetratricopeptide repeat protein [candidate division WWE3 bacterium]MBT7349553.1 tetratricopeptide repeat protein [candidate division WWE3 bacterium]
MKQKKKQKKTKIPSKVLKQHKRAEVLKPDNAYANFKNWKDVKTFLLKNLDFVLLLSLIIIAVYFNSLKGVFISDDVPGYLNNPLIRDFKTALSTWHWQEITYSILFAIFKLNPTPLHVLSVLFHIVSVLSFFIFTSNFFSKRISMFSAMLFAVHPLASEVVAWISAINYPIFSTTTFLAGTSYVMFRRTNNKKHLWISVGMFGLVLFFTKASQALTVFPVIILIDQFLIEKKLTWKSAKHLSWYLIPIGLYLAGKAAKIAFRIDAVSPTLNTGHTSYLTSLPYSIYMTIRLMVFPDKLSLYHDSEPITKFLLFEMYTTFAVLVWSVILTWKKHRKVAGLILIGVASFAYMLSPIQVSWYFAERYVYFATAIFCIFLAMGINKIEKKFPKKHISLIVLVLIAGAYSARTFVRNNEWRTRKSLWEATARVVPLSARTYNNLGDVYAVEENMEASVEAFLKAIELDPNYADATHNLGLTYYKMGELDRATAQFQASLEINPNLLPAYVHLSMVEFDKQNLGKAKEYLEKSLEINPNYTRARQLLDNFPEIN